jgi:hypothetical protein
MLEFKDQGFTRPKVLLLLPFKHSALEFVRVMVSLFGLKVRCSVGAVTSHHAADDGVTRTYAALRCRMLAGWTGCWRSTAPPTKTTSQSRPTTSRRSTETLMVRGVGSVGARFAGAA